MSRRTIDHIQLLNKKLLKQREEIIQECVAACEEVRPGLGAIDDCIARIKRLLESPASNRHALHRSR